MLKIEFMFPQSLKRPAKGNGACDRNRPIYCQKWRKSFFQNILGGCTSQSMAGQDDQQLYQRKLIHQIKYRGA